MIEEKTKEEMIKWANINIPNEACGLVIIENGKEVFVPCKNISEISNTFEIDPLDYALAEDRGEIVRVFHSHCYSPAEPSEVDKVSCEASGLPWTILSVPNVEWHHFGPSGFKAPLVGRQWAHGVQDCLTIIQDYYKEILDILLPNYEREHEWWLKGKNYYFENFKNAGFVEIPISEIREGDVVLMQILSPVINHGAIYLGNDVILHHLNKRLSSRDVYSGYYRKHTVKVLRHKNANN